MLAVLSGHDMLAVLSGHDMLAVLSVSYLDMTCWQCYL